MIFHEQHRRDHDIGAGNVFNATREGFLICTPLRGRMRDIDKPGSCFTRRAVARAVAVARWVSIVTIVTRIGVNRTPVRSATKVGFGIVKCFYSNELHTPLLGITLGVTAGFTPNKKRDLVELTLRLSRPVGNNDRGRRNG